MNKPFVSDSDIETFQRDGVVLIKGLFNDYIDLIRSGIERNMREPGEYAAENLQSGESGRFFDDYCNWTRIPEFETVIKESPAAAVAAQLTGSNAIQIFHDHVLVKEPGTSKATPWHQDSPYYFIDGDQTVSFWSPMDPVDNATLRCVAGSHRWEKPVLPTRWLAEDNFYPSNDDYMPVPDPDAEGMPVREWSMQPGDAVAFHYSRCGLSVMTPDLPNALATHRHPFQSMVCRRAIVYEKTGFQSYIEQIKHVSSHI